jgi:hypothetical protein
LQNGEIGKRNLGMVCSIGSGTICDAYELINRTKNVVMYIVHYPVTYFDHGSNVGILGWAGVLHAEIIVELRVSRDNRFENKYSETQNSEPH